MQINSFVKINIHIVYETIKLQTEDIIEHGGAYTDIYLEHFTAKTQ